MNRLLLFFLLMAALLVVAGAGVLYLAYGLDAEPPRRVRIEGLRGAAEVAWAEGDVAHIRADSLLDGYAALGYAHGARRAWPVALWRQTATGRLAEWFGAPLLPLDRHTRRLGLAALAEETYRALPPAEQALLQAYARGMNAALGTDAVRQDEAFVLLDEAPAPWEPWHPLAIERLYAWLAAPSSDALLADSLAAAAPDSVAAFLDADERLRGWLRLHGFEHGVAWAVRDSSRAHLYQRHVYGSSALPFFQEVVLETPGAPAVMGATLPGTPFFPAGRAGAWAWAVLPSSPRTLALAPFDSAAFAPTYERLLTDRGAERLLTLRRAPGRLLLETPTAAPAPDTLTADSLAARAAVAPADSLWQLQWAGLAPGTDLAAWQALLSGEETPAFRLLRGDGLRMDSAGALAVLGRPQVTERFAGGLLVGNARWARFLADALAARADPQGRANVAAWADDDSSAWAARLVPAMLASLDSLARPESGAPNTDESAGVFGEAVTYLRNWDFRYDRASIGAAVFDTWVRAYRDTTGRRPTPADSATSAENRRRFRALDRAVTHLADSLGTDLRQWRWENVAPDVRRFPVWSADALSGRDRLGRMARTRYAPLVLPGRGHPSALSWGASPVEAGRRAPAAWEAWIGTEAWDRLYVRRRRFSTEAVLGRYRTPERRPAPVVLTPSAPPERVTVLLPASR